MNHETLVFLFEVLNGTTINVSAPDFEEVVGKVIKAKRELTECIRVIEASAANQGDESNDGTD